MKTFNFTVLLCLLSFQVTASTELEQLLKSRPRDRARCENQCLQQFKKCIKLNKTRCDWKLTYCSHSCRRRN